MRTTHFFALGLTLLSLSVTGCGSTAATEDRDAQPGGDGQGAIDAGRKGHDGGAARSDGGTREGGTRDGGRAGDTSTGKPPGDGGTAKDAAGPVSDPTGTSAFSASAFLDSLGVCTHVGQGVDDPTMSATAISYTGVHNLRDDGNPAHVNDWIAMHMASGVRMSLLTNQDVGSTLDMAKQLNAAGALLAVEGPNEPNNFPVTYMGQTSDYMTTFMPVAALQKDLYAAVHGEPTLAGIPVFHSSEAGGSEPDDVGLQFLTIPNGANLAMPDGTQYADYANTHNYVTGHAGVLSDNIAWNASDPTLNGDWDGPYVEYHLTWHGGFDGYSLADVTTLPKVTTETGWTTMGMGSITEEQQARLFLDLYLSAFTEGFSYTFIYMLRDDPVQGYWGLVDTGYNPKTSGTYIHNLTRILADTSRGALGKLDYVVTAEGGGSEPTNVHDLLLQKADGTFELAVWGERLTGGSDAVTVDLHSSRDTVKVYDPTTGTAAMSTMHAVSTVALTLGDHPNIIEIAPPGQ